MSRTQKQGLSDEAQHQLSPDSDEERIVRLTFWLGFPSVLGIFSGWNAIGMIAPFLTPAWAMLYWMVLSAIMWAGLGFGTELAHRLIPRMPLLAKLVFGAIIGVLLTRPMHASYQALFVPLTTNPDAIRPLPAVPVSLIDWRMLYAGTGLLMLFWIGGSLFFTRFLKFAPFARANMPTPAPKASGPAPIIAARLQKLDFDGIELVQAEDHYLRLSGADGEELVLYRFADAIAELSAKGWTRVHRSHCVRDAAVTDFQARGRTLELVLRSGKRVPVSERYRAIAEGLLD